MANSIISPDRFNDLKAKVKAECQRRAYVGSVTDYAGTAYDYTNTPTSNNVISKEHYEKIAVPMNAISGDIDTSGSRIISETEMATLETKATTLSAIALAFTQSTTGCAASCTGLCSTGCYNACTSCTSCSGSGYGLNPNSSTGMPVFKGSGHVHVDEELPWKECDICKKHELYW